MKKGTSRLSQSHREALYALALTVAYMLFWYVSAYQLGSFGEKDLFWGLPAWFIFSCLVAPFLFCLATLILTFYYFQDEPLD